MSKKPLVLLIDDDEWLSVQFSRMLESQGYRTKSVRHTVEGIDAIDRYRPEIIVLDLFMPGPSGIVLLHELRSHSDLAQIPIILCTNSAADLDGIKLIQYGVVSLLDKTIMHPTDIVAAVRKALS